MNSALIDPILKEEKPIYSPSELALVNQIHVPEHVAIIMDGNRRWAKRQGLPPTMGHWKGADTLLDIVEAAKKLGIKVLTVYSFSTENWNRSQNEVNALMEVLKIQLLKQRAMMIREGVRFHTIGDISRFPSDLIDVIESTKQVTETGNVIDLVVALNYGARDEICRAVQTIVKDCIKGNFHQTEISEKLIARYLDTKQWKDPELLIRTSGEKRLSNFLLWQISYSEVYVTDVLWPDFRPRDLLDAILEYQQREHRLGI